jgi:hypothetical protein
VLVVVERLQLELQHYSAKFGDVLKQLGAVL